MLVTTRFFYVCKVHYSNTWKNSPYVHFKLYTLRKCGEKYSAPNCGDSLEALILRDTPGQGP